MKYRMLLCIVAFCAVCPGSVKAESANIKKTPSTTSKAPPVVKITGRYADQITVALLSLLSYAHYMTGRFDFSQQYAEQTIAQYKSLTNPLKGEGLEGQVERAYNILSWIEQWKKEPIVCAPRDLRIVVREQKPILRRLAVYSFNNIPLTVASGNPNIRVRVATDSEAGEYYFRNVVTIEISAEALTKNFKTMIVIGSPKFPAFRVRVPVRVQVQD